MTAETRNLSWRQLGLIQAIAETGQLSLAAASIGLAQPAASRMLAEIEMRLQGAVFERIPKGMVPTPLGELVIRRAGVLLRAMDEMVGEIDAFSGGRQGSVRVGAVSGAALAYVVPAAQALKARTEEADIRIDVGNSEQLSRGLLNGEYDFVLSRLPRNEDVGRLLIHAGRTEVVDFFVRKDHPLAGRADLSIRDLAGFGWVCQGRGSPIRQAIEDAYVTNGVAIPVDVLTTASMVVTLAYLESSNHVAPVSREAATLMTANYSTRVLRVRETIIVVPFHLYQMRSHALNPLAAQFRDMVRDRMSPRALS